MPMLYSLEVHPEFRKKVWTAVENVFNQRYRQQFDSYHLSRWSNICQVIDGKSLEKGKGKLLKD
jgi:hypothetical protein